MRLEPRLWLSAALGVFALGACQNQDIQDIPNRVLDRPTDLVLVCAQATCEDGAGNAIPCRMEALSLSQCNGISLDEMGEEVSTSEGACDKRGSPHLVGFIANSERNEIAMFAKCSNRLVDMNVDAPGYNFLPVGTLPAELDASEDGCRVISANVGSCDLSLLDAPTLAGYGLELPDESQPEEPSTLVSTLVPHRFDVDLGEWIPLASRPGQVLSVPYALTTAPQGGDVPLEGICDPNAQASVYVSFPTCNLVAELDLRSGRVLQSRQFVSDDMGGVEVVDSGLSPICPVECPAQFSATGTEFPTGTPSVDADGPFPQALELAFEPPDEDDPDQQDQDLFRAQELYVGGLGSDILFEFSIGDGGQWGSEVGQLELSDASGIKGIRVSPQIDVEAEVGGAATGELYRFVYVVAGDGSTRVVGRRTVDANSEGTVVECETQLDPNVVVDDLPAYCTPVAPNAAEGQPSERRGFSRGPGIRPGRGEEVTDWMFVQTEVEDDGAGGGGVLGPFGESGTVAVGVTNGGFGVFTMIDQQRALGTTKPSDLAGFSTDPSELMDVRLFSHSLWPLPGTDTTLGLPFVIDQEPSRTIPGGSGATRNLAPSLRQIDATYLEDPRALAAFNLDEELDLDDLRTFYDENVARVAVHDYRSWGSAQWSLEWEGTIQGTPSSTGRLDCEIPGWEGATCTPDPLDQENNADDVRLVDDGATFCDDGVLPGDKLVLIGCGDDDDCGDGRRCLRENAAGVASESTGICIPAHVYESSAAQMREVCAEFISDPCGEARREYTITRVFQDELWFQAMDQPVRSYLRGYDEDGGCPVNMATAGNGECVCLAGFSEEACGGVGEGCCPEPGAVLSSQAPVVELEDRFVCTELLDDSDELSLEDGTCDEDPDCETIGGICVDGRCRRACEDGEDCILRRLPGPACFSEFVRYQVGLRNAFRVSGPGISFVSNLVDIVEVTDEGDLAFGRQECRPTTNTGISRLLTSRLPLPPSDDPDDAEWQAMPVCDDDVISPGDQNPCRVAAARNSASDKYHVFDYQDRVTVSALRFSNPIFSIILDLTALGALAAEVPGYEDTVWPYESASFRRSRIPRGYRQEFGLNTGYQPFADRLTLGGRAVTYPVKIVASPRPLSAYVVDGSGPGSTSSIRGQVLRVLLNDEMATDESFDGVR